MTTTPRGPLSSTVPPESQIVGGVYNATPPAPQDEQPCALQLDANGNLKVVNEAGGVASIVQIEDSTGNALSSNGSGALNVAVVSGGGSNTSVGLTGAAAPTSATEIGIVDGSGKLQNVSTTNPIPVQGPTASGSAPTSNPELIAGYSSVGNAIHTVAVDPSGNLILGQGAGATDGLSNVAILPNDNGNNNRALGVYPWVFNGTTWDRLREGSTLGSVLASELALPADSSPATQNITVVDSGSTTNTGFDNQSIITGSPTAGSAASFAVSNLGTIRVQVSGTWTGTLQSELSMDGGTTWYIAAVHLSGTSFTAATFTGNFQGEAQGSALTNYRLRATAAMTGTAVVAIIKTNTVANVNVVTPIRLQDSTTQSIGGTIKAASTAAIATDTALVVAVSPNNAVATTAGTLAETTAAWTSGTAGNTTLQLNVAGYTSAIVTLNQTTTITGGVVTFEVSDTTAFTNAYLINANSLTLGSTGGSRNAYTLQASTNSSFEIPVAGWAAVRVRLSTAISGTATVTVGIAASAGANSPNIVSVSSGTLSVISQNISSSLADNQAFNNYFFSSGSVAAPLSVGDWVYGGAFSGTGNAALSGWSKMRTPTVFKTVSASATASGNTAVWTPGSGNKFRLLGFEITAQDISATAATTITVSFQDSASGITFGTYDLQMPAVASLQSGIMQVSGGFVNMGAFGYLSSAANNVLNFNVSATVTGATGTFRVNVTGTEE